MNEQNTLLRNRYRISQILKIGSMGKIHLAVDTKLKREVAIKEFFLDSGTSKKLKTELAEAFKNEAKILATLNHPAIPSAYDYFEENETQYIVMEYIRGADLDDIISRQKTTFTYDQVADWIKQLVDIIDYFHSHSPAIVHRDLKPSNIKIRKNGKLCLLDFGISKEYIEVCPPREKSLQVATFEYAPLEQSINLSAKHLAALNRINNEKASKFLASQTSPQSDVFAFGATVYRMLTNHFPVDTHTRAIAVWSNMPDPILPLIFLNQTVPSKIAAFIMNALAIDPADRPQSIREFRQKLDGGVSDNSSVRQNNPTEGSLRASSKHKNTDFLSILLKQKRMLERKVGILEEQIMQSNTIINDELNIQNPFLNPCPEKTTELNLKLGHHMPLL